MITSLRQALALGAAGLLFLSVPAPAVAARGTALTLDPAVGPPTSLVKAKGSGYAGGEVVALYFDGVRVGSDVTSRTGKFNARFRVPAAARPGDHAVDAVGQSSGASGRALFLVRTDWLQGCFDGGRSCFNRYENVVDPDNAGALAVAWRAPIGTDGSSSPVYANGKLFVGTATGLVGLDPASGAIIINYRTGPVSTTPAVIRGFDPQPDPPGKVIFGSTDGILHAVSTSGEPLWQVGLGAVPASPLATCGFPPDPCKVIVGAGNTLFAFDGNGARLWATVLEGGDISKAAAVMVVPPDPDAVIVPAGNMLYKLDASTGGIIWAAPPRAVRSEQRRSATRRSSPARTSSSATSPAASPRSTRARARSGQPSRREARSPARRRSATRTSRIPGSPSPTGAATSTPSTPPTPSRRRSGRQRSAARSTARPSSPTASSSSASTRRSATRRSSPSTRRAAGCCSTAYCPAGSPRARSWPTAGSTSRRRAARSSPISRSVDMTAEIAVPGYGRSSGQVAGGGRGVAEPRAADACPSLWHRIGQSGTLRAAIFGVSDGLVSNLALVMGVAGATTDGRMVLLAGLAGLLAGSFSMAAGEWISMTSQRELFERQIDLARDRCRAMPGLQEAELAALYERKGIPEPDARSLAARLMADPDAAVDTKVREELGLDPDQLGSPWGASIGSLLSFTAGAFVPLAPYLVARGSTAFDWAMGLSMLALAAVGAGVSLATGRRAFRSALRQVVTGAAAASVTYVIGTVIGVQVGG